MNKIKTLLDTKTEKLIYEKINIEGAINEFTILLSTLSEKKVRKEVSRQIKFLKIRLLELNRVFSILKINY